MGYTPAGGDEGLGVFNNTPSTTPDFNKLLELLRLRGNTRKGSTSQRNALPSAQNFEGLLWWDTTLDFLFANAGAGLTPIAGVPVVGAAGHSPGVTPSTAVEFLRRDHTGMVEAYWSGTYTNPLANGSVVGSFPAGFRPGATYEAAAVGSQGGSGPVVVTITASGAVTVFIDPALSIRKVSFLAKFPAAV